jgi:tetratricopeptide (TPR) repeat protein
MYSAKEVAQIVGLQESRVRYWAQTGFVGPSAKANGRAAYTFQDLVGLKAAKELLDRGITLKCVRKNLEALRQQMPEISRPLAQLRIVSDGDRLVVLDEQTRFEPTTGQLVMDFALGALETQVAELKRTPAALEDDSAYAWFVEGQRLEQAGAPDEEAMAAYTRALEGDPGLAGAHTNLGNLFYRRGDAATARRHYHAALTLDGEQPEARYNLANLLAELGEEEQAIAEWYRVISSCPEFADAHYNLALALEREGSHERARSHLERYLSLDGTGEWADRARQLLQGLL